MKNAFLSCLLMLALSTYAQTGTITLTKRQVMDFEVGDVFHYSFYSNNPGETNNKLIRKEVIAKAYNNDSTELTYTFDRLTYGKHSLSWCTRTRDTLIESYTALDSLCYTLFPVEGGAVFATVCQNNAYYSPVYTQMADSAYNYRLSVNGQSSWNYQLKYAAGLGEVKRYSSYTYCIESETLIYYQKGAETFGTPDSILLLQTPLSPPQILTVGEVYNFDVGDVIQYTKSDFGYGYYFTHLIEHRFLSKEVYNDSLVYHVAEKDTVINQGGLPSYTQAVEKVLYYTKLNKPVIETSDLCYTSVETQDTCGNILINKYDYSTSGYRTNTNYYKGLGSYLSGATMQFPASTGAQTDLVYFHKAAQNLTCGNYFSFPSSPIDTLENV